MLMSIGLIFLKITIDFTLRAKFILLIQRLRRRERVYSIGMFSKINRITTKTLRHYDEIGLLKPEEIDRFTGYRYYTSNQLPVLHKILTLKQMGLALNDIKTALENSKALEIFLKLKEQELIKSLREEEIKLMRIRNFSNMLKGENNMYTPVIKELPEVIVASMRQTVSSYDEFFHLMPNVMGPEMERVGCVCSLPEYCFNIYHDGEYKERDIDVECCEAVTELKEDTDIIKFKVMPKVDTSVCVLHKGPYSTLGEAYTFAFKWIEDNNYKVADNPRESYIDGIWNKDSEEEWLTELQIPVEMAAI
jgi:DNA-binding transcriptional MerR regulator